MTTHSVLIGLSICLLIGACTRNKAAPVGPDSGQDSSTQDPSSPYPKPQPKPQPSPQPNPQPQPSSSAAEAVVQEINRQRVSRGLSELVVDPTLTCAEERHAKDIGQIQQCTHTGSDGSSPWDRARACGNTVATGEIVACGYPTAAGAVQGWINSPAHAQIMFDPANQFIGAAMSNNYWAAMFSHGPKALENSGSIDGKLQYLEE